MEALEHKKEVIFLSVDGCSEWASELFIPGYQLKPSDRSKLNWSIKEYRRMVEKLNVILKDSKEHNSTFYIPHPKSFIDQFVLSRWLDIGLVLFFAIQAV